jgi:hypothetical protein
LIEQAPNIAAAIIKAIPNAVGGGVRGVGRLARFATGGQGFVKSVPSGFGNDSFPARLTSGELVVDRSTALKLKDFLNNQTKNKSEEQSIDNLSMIDAIKSLVNQPLVVNIDGRQVARVVRGQVRQGFVI